MPNMMIIAAGKKPMKPTMEPPPFPKSAKPAVPKPSAEHEAAETPEYEGNEEAGAKLISDIEAAGESRGMDGEQSRQFAADVFDAMSACLRKGSAPDAEEEQDESA